jgi:hypothetical protein
MEPQESNDLFRSFGGRPLLPPSAMKDAKKFQSIMATVPTDSIDWNFGVKPPPARVQMLIQRKPTLYARFPKMKGAWDGTTTINHYLAAQKVLGAQAEDLIQYQPRGTCGGRAGSGGADLLQCILIAGGRRAKFHRVSHAFLYWQARKKYGMAQGNPGDENNDGVASGAIPEVMASIGLDHREETGDTNWYGQGSDDLATQWGCGKIAASLADKLTEYAKDNVVSEWAPVKSAQELADGIAAGGIGIGSDSQGFTMTRDKDGFCRPQGTWQHYQTRMSVGVYNGRQGFGYWQSWGKEGAPGGPPLPGHPGNCFGVDFATQDKIIKSGDWAVIFGYPLWELDKGPVDIPWTF